MTVTLYCDQCEPLAINNTATHEQGCPNRQYPWVRHGHCLHPKNIAKEDLPKWAYDAEYETEEED